jgi:Divalent cation transporter
VNSAPTKLGASCCVRAWFGLVNGLAFGLITGVAAVAWFNVPRARVVIGLAIVCNLVAGALGGILIPIALERLRTDPAVASGTFVTTVTDVVGFYLPRHRDALVRPETAFCPSPFIVNPALTRLADDRRRKG